MRVDDRYLIEFANNGFVVVPDFLNADELAEAQTALATCFPTGEQYFANPDAYPEYRRSQFAGLRELPFAHRSLSLLTVHPDLIDVAQRILGTAEVRLYKGEVWAKYGGAIDYDQAHHRDFANHTLVVPRADGRGRMLTTFLYLCDVSPSNGATAIVPAEHTRGIPLGESRRAVGDFADVELSASATAGSLLLYSTEIFHRGTRFVDPLAARFMLLADYRRADTPWVQKQAFGNHGNRSEMIDLVTSMSPTQRTMLDIPGPGHWYWNEQTITDMAIRYPGIDMSPYAAML